MITHILHSTRHTHSPAKTLVLVVAVYSRTRCVVSFSLLGRAEIVFLTTQSRCLCQALFISLGILFICQIFLLIVIPRGLFL